ncbi:hypothetical protein BKA56DRAFT_439171, partial [Ilyonectria sp. MPI-CAGE-AT-0026]
ALVLLCIVSFPATVTAADECQPITWEASDKRRAVAADPTSSKAARPTFTNSVPKKDKYEPGDVNCRDWGKTYKTVNYYSCKKMALKYGIDIEFFFKLNPILDPDCEDITPYTQYCIAGFIEPKRAFDGHCGPKHANATCVGTGKACCNSETWTCGNSDEDCAPGVCYEGLCPGHVVYTTDGKCGQDHGMRVCAGKWGECCNNHGECGTGPDYCSQGKCQLGQCTNANTTTVEDQPNFPWLVGNTTDGTCGGRKGYTCDVVYGNCCNKNGYCGSLPADCGKRCQSKFGKCGS